MNTHQAAEYCGVTESIIRYVARRDGFGTKQNGRMVFTFEELDRAFGASAPFVARLQAELTLARAVIAAVRKSSAIDEPALNAAVADYDKGTKVSSE